VLGFGIEVWGALDFAVDPKGPRLQLDELTRSLICIKLQCREAFTCWQKSLMFSPMEQIHGHEVMQMMLHSGKPYTRSSLIADIIANFGVDARFHTCSAENLTPEGLIDFLQAKGKFVPCEEGFQTSEDLVCKH